MEVVRLFVAVAIPDAVKERLAAFQETLRATDAHVNWTRADGIHITLKFLGEVESDRVPEIGCVAIGHAVNGFSPFTLQAAGTGMFPNASKPRVAWVGLGGETKKLVHLQRRVEAEFEAIGFPHEKRAFTPHVTLGAGALGQERARAGRVDEESGGQGVRRDRGRPAHPFPQRPDARRGRLHGRPGRAVPILTGRFGP